MGVNNKYLRKFECDEDSVIYDGRPVPKTQDIDRDRVYGTLQRNDDGPEPISFTEIYFVYWGGDKAEFFLTTWDAGRETQLSIYGAGLTVGSHQMSWEPGSRVDVVFHKKGTTEVPGTLYPDPTLSGTLHVLSIEKNEKVRVAGHFRFRFNLRRPGSPDIEEYSFVCHSFDVSSENYDV